MNNVMNAYKVFDHYPEADNFLIEDTLENKTIIILNHFMSTKVMFPDGSKLMATDYRNTKRLAKCLEDHNVAYEIVTPEMKDYMRTNKIKVGTGACDVEMTKSCYNIATVISMNRIKDYVLSE